MDLLKKIGSWADALTQIGISLIAFGVVLEVLFGGVEIPFFTKYLSSRKYYGNFRFVKR